MNFNQIIEKLEGKIRENNIKEDIEVLEEQLSKNAEELSKNEKFFNLPLNNIFSVISKVDFNLIEEYDKNIEIIRNIIKNIMNTHFEEKETILILQNLNLRTISFEDIFSLLELITNCPILVDFCNLYKERDKEVNFDYEYELQLKNQGIEKLKQEIKTLYQLFIPDTEKPKDYEPDIFKACKEGKLTSVQYLLEQENEDPYKTVETSNDELKIYENDTPIHIATQNGHILIILYLIEIQKVDKNIQGFGGKTALHYACENGHLPIVEYLISKGANIEAKDEYGDYVIHYASTGGHLPIVKYLIERQNVDKDIKGFLERTPLHYACKKGHFPIVEYLISKGANIEAEDEYGKTPLHFACENGHLQIVEYLISKGANIEAKDEHGDYVIHHASTCGNLSIVQYLIERQNVDKDIKGFLEKTPLHCACEINYLPMVEFLISKGANIEANDIYGETALHLACEEGHLQIVEYLISKGANIEAEENNKRTPLHCASFHGNPDIVEFLVSKKANKNAKTKDGKTPYDLACAYHGVNQSHIDEIRNVLK